MNVIAESVEFTIDIRSKNAKSIDNIYKKIIMKLDEVTADTNTKYSVDIKLEQKPVDLSEKLIGIIEKQCNRKKYSYKKMLSGAAHDSMIFAPILDTAMVFVPSKEGRSHCKEEYTDCKYLEEAISVVKDTIISLERE